jgi:hypothetical protein
MGTRALVIRVVLATWLVLALSGCFMWIQPQSLAPAGVSEPMIRSTYPAARSTVRQAPEPAIGTLKLTIHWPMGPGRDLRGYHAQLIPDSTSRIAIAIRNDSSEIATASVSRQKGQAEASATFKLEVAANLSVAVEAFSVPPVSGEGSEVLVAQGSAIANVRKSQDTSVDVTLTSLYVPSIRSLSRNAARPGDSLRLDGSTLQVNWNPGGSRLLVQTDQGTASAQISGISASSIDFLVPNGTVTGPVEVVVDGVPSVSNATLWISDDIRILASRAAWDTTPDGQRTVLFNGGLGLTATYSFKFAPQQGPNNFGSAPLPVWTSQGDSGTLLASTVDETSFTAGESEGALDAVASLGNNNTATLRILSRAMGPFANASLNLPQGRRTGGIVLANRLHLIGSRDQKSTLISAIDPKGQLAPWLDADRAMKVERVAAPIAVGHYLYVLGGFSQTAGNRVDTIERAEIDDDGSIRPFTAPGVRLRWATWGRAIFTGTYVYVFGGGDGERGLQRSLVDGNGVLGPFVSVQPGLLTDRGDVEPVVAGAYVYLIGGFTDDGQGGFRLATIDRAPIDATGALGSFESWGGSALNAARNGHSVVVAGGAVYVIGGNTNSGTLATVERAPLAANGDLGPFRPVEATLGASRHGHLSAIVGDYLYAIGGFGSACGCDLASVERAAIPTAGDGSSQVVVR